MDRSRKLRLAISTLGAAIVLAACGTGNTDGPAAQGSSEEPTDAETQPASGADGLPTSVTLGFADEVPYAYLDADGQPAGQAPTIATEIFDRLGIDVEDSVVVEFGALINGLTARRYDVIAAGMYINEERASQALFSDPDYCMPDSFGVEAGNPLGLTDYESVIDSGAKIGVLSGSVMDGQATSAGVPEDQLSRFASLADLVDGLTLNNVIDAFVVNSLTTREQLEDIEGYESTEGFFPTVDGDEVMGCGGYLFRLEDKQLRDAFNDVLNEMQENDELAPLIAEYGFGDDELGAAKDVTVEDMIGKPYDFNAPD